MDVVILYGSQSCSTTLANEHKLRVVQNKICRNISASKWDEVARKKRRLSNEVLHKLHESTDNEITAVEMGPADGQWRLFIY